jgi:glycosyltransferase involved in cell wall biosynthesis
MEDKKNTISRTIERKQFDGDVEIIVPFYGKHSNVSKLLQSIFNSIHSNRYLITLVDDASKNDNYYSQIQKANLPGVRILRKTTNGGFGSAVNFALKNPFKFSEPERVIPYVVIMHSDVLPSSKDWLFNLGSSLERMKADGVKMVSPLTDNPVDPMERLVSKTMNPNEDDFVLTEEEFLPMYCSICHRDLFKYVSIPELPPHVGLEAKEFAQGMRARGFFQGVCCKSWVHHEGGSTLKLFEKKRRRLNNVAKNQGTDGTNV